MQSNQEAADKEARRLVKIAYKTGGKVGLSLSRLISLNVRVKVIRAVYRG